MRIKSFPIYFYSLIFSSLLTFLCLIFPLNHEDLTAIWLWLPCIIFSFLFVKNLKTHKVFSLAFLTLLLGSSDFVFFSYFYIWYLPALFLVLECVVNRYKISNVLFWCATTYFLVLLSFFFVINPDLLGLMYGLKYYLTTIFFVAIFYSYLLNTTNFEEAIKAMLILGMVILLFGIIQFAGNITFGVSSNPFNILIKNIDFRPSAFFSETTWFGEFSVLIFFLGLYAFRLGIVSLHEFVILGTISLFSVIISSTLAAYLSFAIVLLMNLKSVNIRSTFTLIVSAMSALIILCCISYQYVVMFSNSILYKLTVQNKSAHGRWDAILTTIHQSVDNLVFFTLGHGFAWDKADASQISGSAFGAKAFSLPIFILYTCGLAGVFLIGLIIIIAFINFYSLHSKCSEKTHGLNIFVSYLTISFVAPLFQYPLGVIWLALSLVLLSKGLRNERNSYYFT